MEGIPVTGEESGDRAKGSRLPPDVEEEVLGRLPWWRRELLRMKDRAQAEAGDKGLGKDER